MQLRKQILALMLLVLAFASVVGQQQQSQSTKESTKEQTTTATDANPTPSPSPAAPTAESSPVDDRLPFMAETAKDTQDPTPSTGGLMLRTLGALLLIVGLIVAAAWMMKRFGGARFGKVAEGAPELSVLNTVALGDKRSVAIIRFGERTLLVGSTTQSITVLAESTDYSSLTALPSVAEMLGEDDSVSFSDELSVAERGGEQAQW
jgi:flagellar protein FliO/FliZ